MDLKNSSRGALHEAREAAILADAALIRDAELKR